MTSDDGVRLSLRYDLRAPAFGPPAEALYAAALEQSEWAEGQGFELVNLTEHHASDDGYCPSPLVLAAAITGRTRSLRVLVAALVLPLYDPIRTRVSVAMPALLRRWFMRSPPLAWPARLRGVVAG